MILGLITQTISGTASRNSHTYTALQMSLYAGLNTKFFLALPPFCSSLALGLGLSVSLNTHVSMPPGFRPSCVPASLAITVPTTHSSLLSPPSVKGSLVSAGSLALSYPALASCRLRSARSLSPFTSFWVVATCRSPQLSLWGNPLHSVTESLFVNKLAQGLAFLFPLALDDEIISRYFRCNTVIILTFLACNFYRAKHCDIIYTERRLGKCHVGK